MLFFLGELWACNGCFFSLSSLNLPVSVPHPAVYMEGFIIAASNLPGNIFTILVMDSTGGKTLLCESDVYKIICQFNSGGVRSVVIHRLKSLKSSLPPQYML